MIASRHPRRSTRWVAIALVALAAQAVALFHDAWIRHARCAAHGEIMHASDDGHGPVAPPASEHAVSGAPAATAQHPAEHEHCQPLVARAQAGTQVVLTPVAPPSAAAIVFAQAPERGTPDRYRLAPKTSPPRAATRWS